MSHTLTLSLFGNKMLKLALIIRSYAVIEHESRLKSFDEFDSSYDVPNAVYFWTNWKSHGIDYHNVTLDYMFISGVLNPDYSGKKD